MLRPDTDRRAELAPIRGRPSILVVDDSEQNRDMLSRRLIATGSFEVDTAADGDQALELIEQGRYDLVLLDVMMPGIDGFEVLDLLREAHSPTELPIIMVTACEASQDVCEALRLGANDYVTKPLDFDVVLARVRTQLLLKEANDQVHDLNARLDSAQNELLRAGGAPAAVEDIENWSKPLCSEVARMLGARRVSLEQVAGGQITSTRVHFLAPDAEVLRRLAVSGGHEHVPNSVLFAVTGMTGEMYAVLDVQGERVKWRDKEIKLVSQFARQLGGALELRRMQSDLTAADRQREQVRAELLRQGVQLVRICPECDRCYGHEIAACEVDGTELPTAKLTPYRLVDRYRLLKILGEGGMGAVFQARDERLDRDVALKIIRPERFNDADVIKRFELEARIVARIQHPNVIAVYDSGEIEDGSLFIVMELLDGLDLGTVLRDHGPGTPAQVAELLRQCARGIAAAHKAELVHRDIKPANLCLLPGRDGGFEVKVLDFGIAKDIGKDSELTRTGMILGTPAYMAPEQIKTGNIDTRADVFSLAAVGYEALSGRKISLETEIYALIVDIVENAVPPVSSLVAGTPHAVDLGFERGLSKKPEDRPRDIEAWVESFADALTSMPTEHVGWPTTVQWKRFGAPKIRGDGVTCPTIASIAGPSPLNRSRGGST
jgi:CheY-like chemotaxis protein